MGGSRLQPFLGTVQHLGYPTYFMTIHTIWYILGGAHSADSAAFALYTAITNQAATQFRSLHRSDCAQVP
jgi:hypothetical protein